MNSSARGQTHPKDRGLWAIVLFKFFHVLMLLIVGLAALHFLSHDLGDFADRVVNLLRVDPDNGYISALLEKLDLVSEKQLKEVSIGSFIYAAITLTEAIGLACRKRWAEYFTIVITGSFLPLEIYEIAHRATAMKFVLLGINLAILGYLIVLVRRKTEPSVGVPGKDSGAPALPIG